MSPAARNRWMVIPPSTYAWRIPRAVMRHDVSWRPRHPLDYRSVWRGGERTGAEHEYELLTIGPGIEGQNRFECLAADDQGIYRGHELIVAMWFPAARR